MRRRKRRDCWEEAVRGGGGRSSGGSGLWMQQQFALYEAAATSGGGGGTGGTRRCEEATKAAVDAEVARAVEGDGDSDGRSRPGKVMGSAAAVRRGVRRMNGSGRFVDNKSSLPIKGLPLNLWNQRAFELLGEKLGGLLEVSDLTIAQRSLEKAVIKVKGSKSEFFSRQIGFPCWGDTITVCFAKMEKVVYVSGEESSGEKAPETIYRMEGKQVAHCRMTDLVRERLVRRQVAGVQSGGGGKQRVWCPAADLVWVCNGGSKNDRCGVTAPPQMAKLEASVQQRRSRFAGRCGTGVQQRRQQRWRRKQCAKTGEQVLETKARRSEWASGSMAMSEIYDGGGGAVRAKAISEAEASSVRATIDVQRRRMRQTDIDAGVVQARAVSREQEEHGSDNDEQVVIPTVYLGDSSDSSVSNFKSTVGHLEAESADEADWMEQVKQIEEPLGHSTHDRNLAREAEIAAVRDLIDELEAEGRTLSPFDILGVEKNILSHTEELQALGESSLGGQQKITSTIFRLKTFN
ncbi:hypothetical protein Scep_025716 [Stephania cephalantha]|uniref:DUF4283 domain-containing protein n=1 Tax=Stephania cephalantha TaxID=152367 RepID=A0AAP0ENZ5_9MAGN